MSNSGAIDWTSNRVVFVTLNTSQRNCSDCDSAHGIFQRLERPMSILKKPWPRIWLRAPESPGKGAVNELMAARPFLKMLTVPSGFLNAPVCTGPVKKAFPPSCQLVGQLNPPNTFNGNPLVCR